MPKQPSTVPRFPTLPRAARLLGVSTQTLRRAAERGELPLYRVRNRWTRVDWAEAVEWVKATRLEPESPWSDDAGDEI